MDGLVLFATDHAIGIVTLNRPPLYAARPEVGERFSEMTRKDGLGAALKWRAAQFAE
jgi:hypothetical protein